MDRYRAYRKRIKTKVLWLLLQLLVVIWVFNIKPRP